MSIHSSFQIELKRFTIVSIAALVLLIAQFFVWNFVESSANRLQEKRTQETQLINLQERIAEVEATFENQQALLDQLEVIFPNRGATSQAVERLERLAEQEGVSLEIKSISETEKEQLVELEVAVIASGPAPFLLQYMDVVEHVSELTKISKWTVEPSKTKSNEEDVVRSVELFDLSMSVIFYMQANSNGG